MSRQEVDSVLVELGTEVALEEPQAEAEARRRRMISQMQRVNVELVREGQKLRWLRLGVGGGLVAGVAAAVAFGALGPLSPKVDMSLGGIVQASSASSIPEAASIPLRTEMTKGSVTRATDKVKERLGLGDSLILEEEHVLVTEDDSHARVHGGRGLDIDVGPGSRVVVGAVDAKTGAAKIQLSRGYVSCSVDPAGEGAKLAVVTPDAVVDVKGTIFSVEVLGDGSSTRSCVRVQRGLVSVTRKGTVEQVGAGQASGCEVPAPSSEEAVTTDPPGVKEKPQPSSLKPKIQSATLESGLPSLAVQNSLFARALAAERQGNLREAEHQLTELLGRFPDSPLLADAEAARARIRKRRAELSP
jgi:hypothetical protein